MKVGTETLRCFMQRYLRDHSLRELAHRSGVSERSLGRLLVGQELVDVYTADRILAAVGSSLAAIPGYLEASPQAPDTSYSEDVLTVAPDWEFIC